MSVTAGTKQTDAPLPSQDCGEIHACHYLSRKPIRVSWKDGVITAVSECDVANGRLEWIAPPLLDLQVNGFAGIDFQQDNLSLDDLLKAAEGLRNAACPKFFFTLITDSWESLIVRVEGMVRLREHSNQLASSIAGVHIEGPFLSAEPGYRGAHDATVMCDPHPKQVEQLRNVASSLPILLTLAPERAGAIATIRKARELGIRVSLGHSDASAEILQQAIDAGATGFTHLANGCPQRLDRHNNILWRVLEQDSIFVSFIPDGIHVSPSFFRIAHRLISPDRIYYTADPMSAAGSPPGKYRLRNHELEVGADGIVRVPGQSNFAGSALTPLEGVRRASQMLRRPWQEAWDSFSRRPSQFIGLKNELAVGNPADFCLISEPQNSAELFGPVSVYINGQRAVNGE